MPYVVFKKSWFNGKWIKINRKFKTENECRNYVIKKRREHNFLNLDNYTYRKVSK